MPYDCLSAPALTPNLRIIFHVCTVNRLLRAGRTWFARRVAPSPRPLQGSRPRTPRSSCRRRSHSRNSLKFILRLEQYSSSRLQMKRCSRSGCDPSLPYWCWQQIVTLFRCCCSSRYPSACHLSPPFSSLPPILSVSLCLCLSRTYPAATRTSPQRRRVQ